MSPAAPIPLSENEVACAKRALEFLEQHRIPPIPDNYAVWYYYTEGKNKELVSEIEAHIAAELPFTRSICLYLYHKYVLATSHKAVDDAANNAQKVLHEVLKVINGFSGETKSYNKDVDSYIETVVKKFEGTGMQHIAKELIAATTALKQSGEKMAIRFEESTKEITSLKKDLQQVTAEVQRDFLTGLYNRKRFESLFDELAEAARDKKHALCLLMIDIDHFKTFNDRFGHLIGDEVLKIVARTLTDMLKGRDVVARFGGEEFVVVLPETPIEGAMKIADIIRAAIASKELKRKDTGENFGNITISVGISRFRHNDTLQSFIKRADDALYESKRGGRNRVTKKEA